MELRTRPGEGHAAALGAPQRLSKGCDCLSGALRIQADEIGRRSNFDAVVVETHQPRGSAR